METIEILKKVGAVLEHDHFIGTSGLHLDTYLNKDALYPHTAETSRICELFAEKYKDENIETVVAPALGGIILSQWTAYHLSRLTGREVCGVYTEKTPDKDQIFTRGYDTYIKGKRVLVLEDNVLTGGSVKKVVDAVKNAGGNIVGVCAMANRNPDVTSEAIGAPFDALAQFYLPAYKAEDCPMCKSGMPINMKVGHGRKLAEKKI
jgi:orotate phosphoribosyltransferase